MNKDGINQNYGAYYPKELDENLKEISTQNEQKSEKPQKNDDFLAQNASKNENSANFASFEKFSKLVADGGNSEILSTIMALKNKNLPEAISALSQSKKHSAQKTSTNLNVTFEEL